MLRQNLKPINHREQFTQVCAVSLISLQLFNMIICCGCAELLNHSDIQYRSASAWPSMCVPNFAYGKSHESVHLEGVCVGVQNVLGCIDVYWMSERIRSPSQRPFHTSAVSEPSPRALSTITAGFLQAELPVFGRVVQFQLTHSSTSGPCHWRYLKRYHSSLLYKPPHKADQGQVKAEQGKVNPY